MPQTATKSSEAQSSLSNWGNQEWFTVVESANLCGLPRYYFYNWLKRGFCPLLDRPLTRPPEESKSNWRKTWKGLGQIYRDDIREIRKFVRARAAGKWLTRDEAAERTGLSGNAFRLWYRNDRCPLLKRPLTTHSGFKKGSFFVRAPDVEKIHRLIKQMPSLADGKFEDRGGRGGRLRKPKNITAFVTTR